ncbi:MAG: ATP-binding protein [Bryobacteraceae bacterium]|nr:ATP-binding protein [Bryobacteraceae bacterium]
MEAIRTNMAEPCTILVGEPDSGISEMLRRELNPAMCSVETPGDGEQVWRRLNQHCCRLVIADRDLPGLGGFDLLRRMRSRFPGTPLILTAAAAHPEEIIAAIRDQAYSFFRRPYPAPALIDMVKLALTDPCCINDIELVSAVPHWVALRLACKFDAADRAVQFFREFDTDFGPEDRDQMATALREVLLNAIEHGGKNNPNNKCTVTRLRTDTFVGFYIRDPGPGFSFDDLKHAAISNPPDSATDHLGVRQERGMRPGGFGISLARQLLDGLFYNEKGNEVILIKNLVAARTA